MKTGIPLVLSLGLFLYFFHFLNMREFIHALANASFSWLVGGLILYCFQVVLKAYRFKLLFESERDLKQLIGIQSVQIVSNNILPAWFGEIILPFLFKKIMKIGYAQSLSSMFIIRMVDFLISILLVVFTFTFLHERIDRLPVPIISIQLIGFCSLLAILAVLLVGRSEKAYQKFVGFRFMQNWTPALKAGAFLGRIHFYFRSMISLRSFSKLLLSSVFIYAALYWVFVSVCNAIHAQVTYGDVFFVFVLIFPIELLPIRSFMNLGTYELGWIVALMLIGYTRSEAALIAFGTHTLFMLYFTLIAITILFLYRISEHTAPAASNTTEIERQAG